MSEDRIRQSVLAAKVVSFPGASPAPASAANDLFGAGRDGQGRGEGGGEAPAAIDLDLSYRERNDIGNAERLLARHGDDLLFVRERGWMVWTGTHWDGEGADHAVERRAQLAARAIFDEVKALQARGPETWQSKADFNKAVEDLFKWGYASGNSARIDGMINRALPHISVGPNSLDADPDVLNLANGTLRLAGACDELRPHSRGDRLAKIMDVDFDPEATCPTWHQFLGRVQPSEAVRGFLQRWIGYCLTGFTNEQALIFNYGTGSNGKSVFVDLIARMLGPYAQTLPFESLIANDRRGGGDATPDLAELPGKRFVRASEPEQGVRLGEAMVKALTGGEKIMARRLHQGFFEFTPAFKLMVSGNHKPTIRGQDHGIWRRVRLVLWGVTIPREEWDRELPAKLWAERSGILNWALDGLRVWLERGLEVPHEVVVATEEYRHENDPVGRFVSECIKLSAGGSVQAKTMYRAYCAWCRANAEKPWSMTAFGKALPERGIRRVDGRIRYYDAVELVNVPDEMPIGPDDDGGGD
ncbi:MAG: hypothetical protein J0H82_04490 [Alphaproteobacteria bacterium]|nr:hypothetical protein [Alphaproteobacteria bacterium]